MKRKKEEKKQKFIVFDTPQKQTEFSKYHISRQILTTLEEHEQELKGLSYQNVLRRLFGYFHYDTRGNRRGFMTWVNIIIPNVDKSKLDYYEFKRLIELSYKKSEKFMKKLREESKKK